MMTGRAVLVTGAASGIGKATAFAFADAGATRIACLDLAVESNEETARALAAKGVQALALTVDLGDVAAIKTAYAAVLAAFGELDAAAHVGGYSWRGDTLDVTAEQWDRVVGANLRGTFFCCQAALAAMYPRGRGAIVNMSADAAFHPLEGYAVQAAAKGGVALMTRTLGLEAARRGIRVNAVSPGITASEYEGVSRPEQPPLRAAISPRPAADAAEMLDQTAAGRAMAPAEIAASVVFLCSDQASAINGQTVALNGGGYFTLQF